MSNKNESKLFYYVVGDNIKKYRDIRKYSLQTLGDKVGVTKKTIQRYENGEIKIDIDRLSDIAEALNVEVSQLIEGAEAFLGVDLNELDMIKVPIVGSVSCGNGIIAYENIEGYEETPRAWVKGGEFFYVRAEGDSMINARIHNGDLLLIRKQEDVEEGEIAAVLINEKVYLKRVFKTDGIMVLQSENPDKYGPIFRTEENQDTIKILGKLKKIVIDM
ncbi:XRE family transcriptional regulator [Paenibacillus polymyxa]|uniref:LexA family protein n=1 Tax=Paenibacillus polymyxa TaxID=1406 RepID=UPI002023D77A|nr:XRE family transcriptional regulator [Paenibacillus polymyxa]WDZ63927.1 XRE family transcriptional regulator [Paenibacillus polymyxa]